MILLRVHKTYQMVENHPAITKKNNNSIKHQFFVCLFFGFLFCFVFLLFRAAPVAYGGAQASGPIGAIATGLHHSSQQRQILNPMSGARDGIHVLMDPSRVC